MGLAEVEEEIYHTYQWFAKEAPGVVVQEEGRLAQLWSAFDHLIRFEDR